MTTQPQLLIAIYRGPEDGSDNIINDPYLKKLDPIEATIYKTPEMAIAKGEFELRKAQKIVKTRTMKHALHRIEPDNDEGKIFRVRDERAEINSEICIASRVTLNIQFGPDAAVEMETELLSFSEGPFNFGRQLNFYAVVAP